MNKKEKLLLRSGKALIAFYINHLLEFDVVYEEKIDESHPNILVPNHPTTTDPFFISKLTKNPFQILITANAFAVKGFGSYLRHSGHIAVKKGNGVQIVDQAIQKVQSGTTIAIFPEGRLSPQLDQPAVFKNGLARIALSTQAPITPIGIYCNRSNILISQVNLETGMDISKAVIGGKYFVTVGKPIKVFGNPNNPQDLARVTAQVREEVQRLIRHSEARAYRSPVTAPSILHRVRNFMFNI
jgi:1-acyl-sn-glycerol-3-phosphate acyltransferase